MTVWVWVERDELNKLALFSTRSLPLPSSTDDKLLLEELGDALALDELDELACARRGISRGSVMVTQTALLGTLRTKKDTVLYPQSTAQRATDGLLLIGFETENEDEELR